MTPAERLPIAWSAFKALAIKVKGRAGAAAYLREAADVLDAEQRHAEQRQALADKSNVIILEPRLAAT